MEPRGGAREGLALTDEATRLVALGNDLEDRGRLDEAQACYRQAIAAAPLTPRPWLNLGNVLERQGHVQAAVEAASEAIAVAPDFAPAHFNLGRLLRTCGQIQDAQRALRAALRIAPAFADAASCWRTCSMQPGPSRRCGMR